MESTLVVVRASRWAGTRLQRSCEREPGGDEPALGPDCGALTQSHTFQKSVRSQMRRARKWEGSRCDLSELSGCPKVKLLVWAGPSGCVRCPRGERQGDGSMRAPSWLLFETSVSPMVSPM